MNWHTIHRETSLVEHVCEHGTGHPNFYSAARLNKYHSGDNSWLIHGCDGCCGLEDFPGRALSNKELIARIYEKVWDWNSGCIDTIELSNWFLYTSHDLVVNEGLGQLLSTQRK